MFNMQSADKKSNFPQNEIRMLIPLKHKVMNWYILLPPFQIIRRFAFSSYIDFAMHLDLHYV